MKKRQRPVSKITYDLCIYEYAMWGLGYVVADTYKLDKELIKMFREHQERVLRRILFRGKLVRRIRNAQRNSR